MIFKKALKKKGFDCHQKYLKTPFKQCIQQFQTLEPLVNVVIKFLIIA